MQGRAFLDVARELLNGGKEAHWRAAAVHAHYALILECRDAQGRWGLAVPPKQNVYSAVPVRFQFAADRGLKSIAYALD